MVRSSCCGLYYLLYEHMNYETGESSPTILHFNYSVDLLIYLIISDMHSITVINHVWFWGDRKQIGQTTDNWPAKLPLNAMKLNYTHMVGSCVSLVWAVFLLMSEGGAELRDFSISLKVPAPYSVLFLRILQFLGADLGEIWEAHEEGRNILCQWNSSHSALDPNHPISHSLIKLHKNNSTIKLDLNLFKS